MRRWPLALVLAVVLAACGGDGDEVATDDLDVGAEEPADDTDADDAATDDADDTADDAADDEGMDDAADDEGMDDAADEEGMDDAMEDDAAADGVVLTTAATDFGEVLVDGDGMTLYLFDQDDGDSTCYDDCADSWPPFLGPAEADGGVDAELIGSTTRDDGGEQVTYAGHPLYYFAADGAAGDVNGQAVGDVWWVVSADGDRITDEASAAPRFDEDY